MGLDVYSQHYTSEHFGYYQGFFGDLIITNLALATQNLPRGQRLVYNGVVYINTGKSWIDPICYSRLEQDKNGNIRSVGGC
jgi:uncharacterized membrane protein